MDEAKGRKVFSRRPASGIKLECQECGTVFTKKIGPKTVEVQCPKCKGFDVDLAEEVELEEKKASWPFSEKKWTRYSDLLVQLGRMKQAKDKQGEKQTQIEIDKVKKKLGIQEGEIDLFELDDEMFEAAMKKKSAGERRAAKKKRDKWLKTPAGRKSQIKAKKRAAKVRKGSIKVDKSKSRAAKKRAKLYAGDDMEIELDEASVSGMDSVVPDIAHAGMSFGLDGHQLDSDEILFKVNAIIGKYVDEEFVDPIAPVRAVRRHLSMLGVGFHYEQIADLTYNKEGELGGVTIPLYRWGGRYGRLTDDAVDITSDDGISHKGDPLSIRFDWIHQENNKYTLAAKIISL